jgi:hypothetical protein
MALGRGTNIYFNNYAYSGEQKLIEDLTIEAIKIFGKEMFYIPRVITSEDSIFGEDDQSVYKQAYPIEMYVKSVDGFEGDGVFLSKFGLQINDQVTFTVAKRTFLEEVGHNNGQERPDEGDLVYFPENDKVFQIKYVNYKPFFYQFGQLVTYDLTCELFVYSDEVFETGIEAIDRIQTENSTNVLDWALYAEDGSPLLSEDGQYLLPEQFNLSDMVSDQVNDAIQEEILSGVQTDQQSGANNTIVDWTYLDPFSESKY